MVKSILYSRQNPLNFHFVVNDISRRILTTLFQTWKLPLVEVNFYNSSEVTSLIDWIPNHHYSGIYGLMKITFTELLPKTVDRLLVLDTDVMLVSNVEGLWSFWEGLSEQNLFGLVENLSDWYISDDDTHPIKWPALGRGFNTGVMLMNLKRLREIGWRDIWLRVTKKNLKKFNSTYLADQDIINAVIQEMPYTVFKLPCEWNFQMGFESKKQLCPVSVSDLKAVHWNSPQKTLLQSRYAAFFNRYYKMFLSMDGNLFRAQRLRCNVQRSIQNLHYVYEYDDDDDGCSEFRHARNIVYRTQLYIRPYTYTPKSGDITLVTQFSMDRFVFFETLLKNWPGPISAAIYCTDLELSQLLQHFPVSDAYSNRTNVALHAVFKEGIHFPVNYLRNVALNNTDTDYVFLMDADFLPMLNSYEAMSSIIQQTNYPSKTAFVVPAFELKIFDAGVTFPKDKHELLSMLDAGQVNVFRQDVWSSGHLATDYNRWRNADQPYSVSWQTDYEPYVIVDRRQVPPYDQRFVGFGWNKVSHIMLLDALGFNFTVLPNAFIIHRPHAPSFEIIKYRSSPIYRKCLKMLKGEFVRDLVRSKLKLSES
uniref:Glycosyltransferase-like protein LARGE1 n=1 Tax=Syphacia muris TaxID=451379 RepID=A0A0N5AQ35_9BILA